MKTSSSGVLIFPSNRRYATRVISLGIPEVLMCTTIAKIFAASRTRGI